MKHSGLLKIHRLIALHKAAIAQQHGAKHRRDFRPSVKKRIDFSSQALAEHAPAQR
jgi:hypothetical protein